MRRWILPPLLILLGSACMSDQSQRAREVVFVGVDVSGSFHKAGLYDDSLDFLSYYLYAHLNNIGGLSPTKALFVGVIGGEAMAEPKSFHPIHDFQDKSVEQIAENLRVWTSTSNRITDFNVFFKQVAHISRKRNFSLAPITVILLTDGIPATPYGEGGVRVGRFSDVDLDPLEFLSRKVTVRVLYATARSAREWEQSVPRKRVRMWTVDSTVMLGWRSKMLPDAGPALQEKLWAWIKDTVDFRVRRSVQVRPESGDAP